VSSQGETGAPHVPGDEPTSVELRGARHTALTEPSERAPVPAASATEPVEPEDEEEGYEEVARAQRRRRVRRILAIAFAVVVVAAAVIAATGVLGRRNKPSVAAAPAGPPATAKVKKTTLTRSETVSGTLGYGDVYNVQAPPGAGAGGGSGDTAGIITWLPAEGDVIVRGDTVYRVDQEKIPLLYGSAPLYRTLSDGDEGSDVKMLEQNLSALGYSGFTVDDEYTDATADAVEDWQDDLGRDETGVVKAGDAVVASGSRRVSNVMTSPGAVPNGVLLKWTATTRVVDVDLDTDYADLVKVGTKATVELPDGTEVEAQVTKIGTPTSKDDAQSGGGDSSSSDGATLPVELQIKNQKKLGSYEAAKVDVDLTAEAHKDVLAVPINALVARPGGGYAVEAVEANGVRYLPVKAGIFSDSYVEVSGPGIVEGLVVGVPR
jgi:peptidoglycan hydrolase-like protein with peptidoglycan-binding domain